MNDKLQTAENPAKAQDDTSREYFYDARDLREKDKNIFEAVFYAGIANLFISKEQIEYKFYPQGVKKFVQIEKQNEMTDLSKDCVICSATTKILDSAKKKGFATAIIHDITAADDFHQTVKIANHSQYDYLFTSLKDETNIPLELVLAKSQNRKIKIIKIVHSVQQGEIALGVMEHGVYSFALKSKNEEELKKLAAFLTRGKISKIDLQEAVVKSIRHIGMGHRACVDTTSLMTTTEGMLVGSVSRGGILVCSETHYLPYMNLRPFRVNAGAIHSYIWGVDQAEYLSDLQAGSELLCIDTKGNARKVIVGRIKTEVRPLLLIIAEIGDDEINVILQDDWHVRVMGSDGKAKNITELKAGDKLFGCLFKPGRHVGIAIDETIEEN